MTSTESNVRIAVLVKQIPSPEQLRLDGGRVARDGVALEVNAYCRRANAKAVELAGGDGETVVFTMGPPAAEDALREMIACGATRGVHLCDPAFAGADTLATANVLASAIRREGPFDLILAGLNSLDADTGQVPAELAELLGMSFAPAVRDLDLTSDRFTARLETDDGYVTVAGRLPVVLSAAERLCDPSKAAPELREEVDGARILRLSLDDISLTADQCGVQGSPTTVGPVRVIEAIRQPIIVESVADAVDLLFERGAFEPDGDGGETVATWSGSVERAIWCSFREPAVGAELLGEAAALANVISAEVVAVVPSTVPAGLGALGADRVLVIPDADEPEVWAGGLAAAAAAAEPWALLIEGTRVGRVVASIVAARHGWGLTGDAIGLEVEGSRLCAWKPAFGGRLEAPIYSSSPVQMATVRPGVLSRRGPRPVADPEPEVISTSSVAAIRTVAVDHSDGGVAELQRAQSVVTVGQGVDPADYALIDELRAALGGAALGSTRKVTDKGWLSRGTQIGVTGHSISPKFLVAIGLSGRFNFTVGIRNASVILAINSDPRAEIFDQVDVGIIGDWKQVVPALTSELMRTRAQGA